MSLTNLLSTWRTGFSKVRAGVDPADFSTIATGAGMTVNQAGGNLVITAGTTAGSETILRSKVSVKDSFVARWYNFLSQRIANNAFVMELVDVVGDGLAYTINSTVSVTVAFPVGTNPFTAEDVGQSVNVGAVSGASVNGRYVIASVATGSVTLTVAGWPASGTGTLSLFGRNRYHVTYDGTVVTNAKFDSARKGWGSGDTTATTLTSASPGHMGILQVCNGAVSFLDQLVASATGLQTATRASRVLNIPDSDVQLYLQIRVSNGTVAPATSTTWTIGMASLAEFTPQPVELNSIAPQSLNAGLPVNVGNTSLTVAGTATTTEGTLVTPLASNVVTAASTNASSIKATAGTVYGLSVSNVTLAAINVKLYNKASAPTVGTDVPVLTLPVPAGQHVTLDVGRTGLRFGTGIALAVTAGVLATDTAVVTAGAQVFTTYI